MSTKRPKALMAAGLILGFWAGNFVYQGVFADVATWQTAIDRSFFQAIAVMAAWLFL